MERHLNIALVFNRWEVNSVNAALSVLICLRCALSPWRGPTKDRHLGFKIISGVDPDWLCPLAFKQQHYPNPCQQQLEFVSDLSSNRNEGPMLLGLIFGIGIGFYNQVVKILGHLELVKGFPFFQIRQFSFSLTGTNRYTLLDTYHWKYRMSNLTFDQNLMLKITMRLYNNVQMSIWC